MPSPPHIPQSVADFQARSTISSQHRVAHGHPIFRRHSTSDIEPPVMDYLSSPSTPTDRRSPESTAQGPSPPPESSYSESHELLYPSSYEEASPTSWPSQLPAPSQRLIAPAPRYPLDEATDATASPDTHPSPPSHRHRSSTSSSASPSGSHRHSRRQTRSHPYLPHSSVPKHAIRPVGWPASGHRSPSPRSASSRMSPSLPSKRQAEKKPPLACLFCRGRKIACGPPVAGSKDKTCK